MSLTRAFAALAVGALLSVQVSPTDAAPADPRSTTVLATAPAGAHALDRVDLLPEALPGPAALDRLERPAMAAAATTNGMSRARLRSVLADPTAWMGTDGQVYYVEEAPAAAAASGADSGFTPPEPLADTFALHSDPGARRTIFLDFDGGPVADTWWNDQPDPDGDPRTAPLAASDEPAWDPAGDGAGFSDAERALVQEIWARVAEDYAPFEIDVTTEQPSDAALLRSGSADPTYGVRALIGPSDDALLALCGGQCGGVALIGTFDSLAGAYLQPAWIFTGAAWDDPKVIADAAAHEVGHTFGLEHDGAGSLEYDEGTDLWGPIMGAPYASAVTQWSKGDYPTATNTQDDLALISATGMAPLRDDEAGSTIGTAARPSAETARITSSSDVDVYALGSCTSALTVSAEPAAVGADLDISLELLDATGAVVASDDPPATPAGTDLAPAATGLGASIDAASSALPAGTYFARVRGTGVGTPPDGYSSYGSVGAYTLGTTGCTGADPTVPGAPRDLHAEADAEEATVTVTWRAPFSDGGTPVTGYELQVDGGPWKAAEPGVVVPLSRTSHTVALRARNAEGPGATVTTTVMVPPEPTVPGAMGDVRTSADPDAGTVTLGWDPPTDTGGLALTAFRIHQYDDAGREVAGSPVDVPTTYARAVFGPVPPGTTVHFGVGAVNGRGEGPVTRVDVATPGGGAVAGSTTGTTTHTTARAPGAPLILRPRPGRKGGPVTVQVRWTPPRSTGGAAVRVYRINLYQLAPKGSRAVRTVVVVTPDARTSAQVRVRKGARYRFAVQARNAAGWGPLSARSGVVTGR